jgi:hypothetical protein
MPLTIIASLALLRCVDAEQPHKLRAKLYGITVYDLEARLCGRSDDGVVVGFRVSRGGQHEGKKWRDQCSSYQPLPISPAKAADRSRLPRSRLDNDCRGGVSRSICRDQTSCVPEAPIAKAELRPRV